MTQAYKEARDAVFLELFEIAARDKNVILFTTDTGAILFNKFKEELPGQFMNVGIAEQNAISVAAGLSLSGKKVFVFGISNFVILRCIEQLKIDICSMGLPVTIIGMGTGYVYPKDGPTHHMTDIISLTRTIPGLSIWSPSDYAAIAGITRIAYASAGPNLIYMDKGPFIPLYDDGHDFTKGLSLLRQGSDLTIVATGIMLPLACQAVTELEKRGIDAGRVDLYRIKPVDEVSLLDALGKSGSILTLEENTIIGGLGGLVCETVAGRGLGATVKRLGIPDSYRCEVGERNELRALGGFDLQGIIEAAESLVAARKTKESQS